MSDWLNSIIIIHYAGMILVNCLEQMVSDHVNVLYMCEFMMHFVVFLDIFYGSTVPPDLCCHVQEYQQK